MTEAEAIELAKRSQFPYWPEEIAEIEIRSPEVPEWLRRVGQWQKRRSLLEQLKARGGFIVFAGRTRYGNGAMVCYMFGLRGFEELHKIRAQGTVILPLTLEAEPKAEAIMLKLVADFQNSVADLGAEIQLHVEQSHGS